MTGFAESVLVGAAAGFICGLLWHLLLRGD